MASSFQPRQSFLPYRSLVERGGSADPYKLRVIEYARPANNAASFVLYWAQAHRRLQSNLALDFAIERGNRLGLPVVVYESLRPDYPQANDRIHSFILEGVRRNALDAAARGLRYVFFLPRTPGQAKGSLYKLSGMAESVVTDEYPTFILRDQTRRFAARSPVTFITIDHNGILPVRAFVKEQYSAKFLRDRAHRIIPDHYAAPSDRIPSVELFRGALPIESWDGIDPTAAASSCEIDHSVRPVTSPGGREEGLRRLEEFVTNRLEGYAAKRNREATRTSELSPYLHFGFVGIHEVFERVLLSSAPKIDIDAFLEEAVIRRELSFNFCHFREDHTSLSALPDWALKTLEEHAADRRKPSYSRDEIERGATYDDVWNLAHRGLLEIGTIHNYLRMLWGKKIIEWSATPAEALETMEYLHDKYAIDGRDPNTHAGVLWCLGKHDRAWAPARPIFGMVRYMSSDSTKKKVDLKAYQFLIHERSANRGAPRG